MPYTCFPWEPGTVVHVRKKGAHRTSPQVKPSILSLYWARLGRFASVLLCFPCWRRRSSVPTGGQSVGHPPVLGTKTIQCVRLTSETSLFFSTWCSLDPQEVSSVLIACSSWTLIQMDAPHSFPLTCWSTCGLLTHLDYCEKIFMHRYCVNLSPYFSGIIAPENKCQVIY